MSIDFCQKNYGKNHSIEMMWDSTRHSIRFIVDVYAEAAKSQYGRGFCEFTIPEEDWLLIFEPQPENDGSFRHFGQEMHKYIKQRNDTPPND